MRIELRETPFDPLAEASRYQASRCALNGHYGATALFVGTVRDDNEQAMISRMTLEHYPGMTERQLQRIVATADQEWPLLDALVLHRVGTLQPNDPIVLVAVWSVHRAEAFAACRFIMEELKAKAPFWKREETTAGARWVTHNTPG